MHNVQNHSQFLYSWNVKSVPQEDGLVSIYRQIAGTEDETAMVFNVYTHYCELTCRVT
jgi:hypothetical protein